MIAWQYRCTTINSGLQADFSGPSFFGLSPRTALQKSLFLFRHTPALHCLTELLEWTSTAATACGSCRLLRDTLAKITSGELLELLRLELLQLLPFRLLLRGGLEHVGEITARSGPLQTAGGLTAGTADAGTAATGLPLISTHAMTGSTKK